jgi:hypothetical protein
MFWMSVSFQDVDIKAKLDDKFLGVMAGSCKKSPKVMS